MGQAWLQQQERSNRFTLRMMIWVALHMGRPVGRLLLYPIAAYFLIFSRKANKASTSYLRRVLGRAPSWRESFAHVHCFAATILDRVYLLSGRLQHFSLQLEGDEKVQALAREGRGCLLLGSHLGSFEALRAAASLQRQKLPIKILMYKENAAKIQSVLEPLNPELAQAIIPIGDLASLLEVQHYVEGGGMVGMLGDRIVQGEKTVRCTFFGDSVVLPAGPMLLAHALKVPVILFFGLYRGKGRYTFYFEELSPQIVLPRGQREAAAQEWMQRYLSRVEYYCRLAPYNWFNFYDYWEDGG